MTEQVKPKSGMAKFRSENRRHDYFPVLQAQAAIERLRKTMPGTSTRQLIDTLVVAGESVWFPDANGTRNS